MLEMSLSGLLFSLVPSVLVGLGLAVDLQWRVSSGLLSGAYFGLFVYHRSRRSRALRSTRHRRATRLRPVFLTIYALVALWLACNVAGLALLSAPGVYMIGVGFLLFSAAIEFLFFVASFERASD